MQSNRITAITPGILEDQNPFNRKPVGRIQRLTLVKNGKMMWKPFFVEGAIEI